jgi:hypothetical protein
MGLFGQPKIKDGISAQAVVMSIPTPTEPARSYHLKITLSVRVPGREPYLIKHSCWVHETKYPSPGAVLPVTVDSRDPNRLRIEWDQVLTSEERVRQQHEAMLSGGQPLGGASVIDARNDPALRAQVLGMLAAQGVDITQGGAGGGSGVAAAPDAMDRIAKAAQLRDSGALTQDEFEQIKAKILNE